LINSHHDDRRLPAQHSTAQHSTAQHRSDGELVRIALGQIDSALGDVAANVEQMRERVRQATFAGADLTVFPELAMHGYALGYAGGDRSVCARDERLTALSEPGSDVVVGFHEDGGLRTYNSAAYLSAGALLHTHRKLYLPNYSVWEERKHASPGQSMRAYDTRFGRMATLICNDAWQPVLSWLATQDGADMLLVPTNSAAAFGPETVDVVTYWDQLLSFTARMQQCWVVFVNRVGTEAGANFWGGSRVIAPNGEIVAQAPLWEKSLTLVDIDVSATRRRRREGVALTGEARLGLIEREVHRLIAEGGDA